MKALPEARETRCPRAFASSVLVSMILAAGLMGAGLASAQTLGGVSCSDVISNGQVNVTSATWGCVSLRGLTSPCALTPNAALPPHSGFDYLDGHVWVRHDPATECPNLLNQLFLCLEVAGIPGDADGDGRINNPTHIAGCGTAIP